MKLNPFAKIILVGCTVLTLCSCSARRHAGGTGDDGMMAAGGPAGGAQASGIGDGDGFGGAGGAGGNVSRRYADKNTYYFDFDSNVVHDQDKPAILSHANYLATHPNKKIILEGHTDPRGSREYNIALGERRAKAVAELMKSKGVSPNQVRVVSYGAQRLAQDGHSEEAYQEDRRAKITQE